MDQHPARDADKAHAERVILSRQMLTAQEVSVMLATEDVSAPTHWCFEEQQHLIVVHLGGNLRHMESVFSRGPSSVLLPSIGDIWTIPAGCRYAALAQGDRVRFAAFRLPVDLLGGGTLEPRVCHRDRFLHEASARAATLAARNDDLGRMALAALLEALRYHLADAFLGAPRQAGQPTGEVRRLSARQKQELTDHIDASMHERLDVDGLARIARVPPARLVREFKATFGATPWQYVLRARLARARRLLETGSASITDISLTTGFSSPSHLATSFRKHFGLSPQAYRLARQREEPT